MKRIIAWLWLCIFVGGLAGCGGSPSGSPERTTPKELRAVLETEYGDFAVHLIALLENEERPIYDQADQSYDHDEAPNPERTSIPRSYYYGLFDLTGDGTPELICAMWGYSGSMGNATYAIFDVLSETALGELFGTYEQTLEHYRNRTDGTIHNICVLRYQMGVSNQFEDLVEWSYDSATKSFGNKRLYGKKTTYSMDDARGEQPECFYSIGDEEVSVEAYNEAVRTFESTYERIQGSGIRYVDHSQNTENGSDEPAVLRIAEKLLAATRSAG